MDLLTGQGGLTAIVQSGGVDQAIYGLKRGHAYAEATGRIAETYRQLADGPMTGAALFVDLNSRNWLLPKAGRPYEPTEHRQHLKYMVQNGRLHVFTGIEGTSLRTNQLATRRPHGLAFKVTYNDGGACGGLIGYRGVCSKPIIVRNVEVDRRTWCSDPKNECRQYCDGGRVGRRPKVGVCYESELLSRKPFRFWTGTYHTGQRVGEPIPIDAERLAKGDLVLLTTRAPERPEQDRIIFGCYRVGNVGVDERGNFVESDGTMDLVLPDDIARQCRYWEYQRRNRDGSTHWGAGLFRYLDRECTGRFIEDLVHRLGDRSERDTFVRALGGAVEIKAPRPEPRRSSGRGGGEGDEHLRLKNLVAAKPELIGLPVASTATIEHGFLSGDRVDIKFDLPNGNAAVVEVETIVPLPGAHQAVKYRALLEVERSEALGSGRVEAILVAHVLDAETQELAKKYGIKLVQLRAGGSDL